MSDLPNIFTKLPEMFSNSEIIEPLYENQSVCIERITSVDMHNDNGEWYDQDNDEWVIVLQGEGGLMFDDSSKVVLSPGDYLFIPAHRRHMLTHTSGNPPCIWLTVHILTK